MDAVINRISEIESAAVSIMEEATIQKKEFARTLEEKTKAFDAQIEEKTTKELVILKAKLEAIMKQKLADQRDSTNLVIKQMEGNYQLYHTAYAEQILNSLIEE